jgi:hypothetical protein
MESGSRLYDRQAGMTTHDLPLVHSDPGCSRFVRHSTRKTLLWYLERRTAATKDTRANRNKARKPCPLNGIPTLRQISVLFNSAAQQLIQKRRAISPSTPISLVSNAGSTLSVLEFSISTSDPAIRTSLTKISIQQLSN